MQTLRKKTSPCKYKNDPGRFLGEGVSFRAKLIGILEVGEARGDRMCQEALCDLKVAIRAAGEHKQRISVHVAIDGLRLRDEKTGDSLYHHPVHKISFIAQDMTDSRAFGYIFGSPDSGHRFFGIKTDKAASQVVIAMRDLFQVVFELKKKEIELARQQIQGKVRSHCESTKSKNQNGESCLFPVAKMATIGEHKPIIIEPSTSKTSPESIADLVDLEQELNSLQRGLNQMERLTPSDGPQSNPGSVTDPFGDSFATFTPPPCLPPPPSTRERPSRCPEPPFSPPFSPPPILKTPFSPTPLHQAKPSTKVSEPNATKSVASPDWLQSDVLEDPLSIDSGKDESSLQGLPFDVFTELDPLGTGRSKPYIDKKHFFQELKNPPKKVLKDLVGGLSSAPADTASLFQANFQEVESSQTQPPVSSAPSIVPFTTTSTTAKITQSDPFDDPFGQTDPFADTFKPIQTDPFDTDFVGFKIFDTQQINPIRTSNICSSPTATRKETTILQETKIQHVETSKIDLDAKDNIFNGPLQVSLPPERGSSYISSKSPKLERQTSVQHTVRNRPTVTKQNTMDSSLTRNKIKSHNILSQKFSKKDINGSQTQINMSRLQESDSFSESEAPEPPPRPDNMSSTIPPPLPPKKQISDITIRPPPRPPHTDSDSHYDYIDNYNSSTMEAYSKFEQNSLDKSPPLPVPARRSKFDDNFVAPQRPKKSVASAEDDYLTPITLEKRDSRGVQSPKSMLERPILLPPPQKKDTKSGNKLAAKPETKGDIKTETLDITLSELLAYGMEELAVKLKVPASRLSNMTIAELTTYLSNYLATANGNVEEPDAKQEEKKETAIFKADFDNNSTFQTDFRANFNDDFGSNTFVANFDQFNQNSSFDRYAVFREIQEEENKNKVITSPSPIPPEVEKSEIKSDESPPIIVVKTDGELSRQNTGQDSVKDESEAKTQQSSIDRYAALRDIILIDENDNTKNGIEDEDQTQDLGNTKNLFEKSDLFDSKSNFAMDDNIETSLNKELSRISLNLSQTGLSKSPMNKSPILCKSPNTMTTLDSIKTAAQNLSEIQILNASLSVTDPESRQPNNKSPIPKGKSPISIIKSPISNMLNMEVQGQTRLTSGSLSDVISGSSPEIDNITGSPEVKNKEITSTSESWAIFDTPNFNQNQVPKTINQSTSPLPIFNNIVSETLNSLDSNSTKKELHISKEEFRKRPLSAENIKPLTLGVFAGDSVKVAEYGPGTKTPQSNFPSAARSRKCEEGMSPWSSDGKEFYGSPPDWSNRGMKECERRRRHRETGWGKNHTSSSSRDVSPWEEEGQGGDYRRHSGRHESMTRRNREILRRRCDSWEEDDYDYDEDSDRINWTDRRSGPPNREKASRSREMLDSRPPWSERHDRPSWNDYPDRDFDDRYDRKSFGNRDSFERKSFERDNFDRSFDNFERDRDERGSYYERRKHLGGREFYGSCEEREFDSWENKYRGEDRRSEFKHGRKVDNWVAAEREYEKYATVGARQRRSRGHRDWTPDWTPTGDDWEQDSDGDIGPPSRRLEQRRRRGVRPWTESPAEEGPSSLQDPQIGRKSWKRPSSASETDRRIDRRNHQGGSDGERDRRFRTKSRSRSRESQFSDSRPQKLEPTNTLRSRSRHQRFEHPEEQTKPKLKLAPSSCPRDFDQDDAPTEKTVSTNKLKQMFFDSDFNEDCTKNNFNSNKFDKNDHKLFDADFSQFENSPMSANSAARFRFSNDFSEKESSKSQNSLFENDLSPRKNDSASSIATKNNKFKFENDFAPGETSPQHPSTAVEDKFESDLEAESPFKNKVDINQSFEDDFMPENNKNLSKISENVNFESISEEVDDKSESKVEFTFAPRKEQNGDQQKHQNKTKTILTRSQTREVNLKKSESVNIFAREADPFDDDDFFNNGSAMQVIENKMATKTMENNECTSGGGTDKTEFYKWSGQFDAFDK